jgi:transposase-like protein
VLHWDGIWLTLQTQNQTIQPDKRQRARHQRKGERVVVLVTVGFWRDGRREILDWQRARERGAFAVGSPAQSVGATRSARLRTDSKPSCVMGVVGLGRRFEVVYGSTVIDQRCIFHQLKNVSEACRKELKGDKHKEERKQRLQQACAVYEAESAQQAQEQRAA